MQNYRFFYFKNFEYLCSTDIPCTNSVKKYPVVLEKKFVLLFFAVFSNGGHIGFAI